MTQEVSILRRSLKFLRIGVIAYVIGGIAYWATAESFLRYIGKEIVFSPVVSFMLRVPFWPMMVFADLRWVGVRPQDVVAVSAVPVAIYLLWIKTSSRDSSNSKSRFNAHRTMNRQAQRVSFGQPIPNSLHEQA